LKKAQKERWREIKKLKERSDREKEKNKNLERGKERLREIKRERWKEIKRLKERREIKIQI